ncbi:low molecular weight phosphatase family protein [Leifsonia sp. NCR5]|uniref:arsenate-mycothiol transferase ArsC n=1 Tax=Leifsonia sp. NCR5 TaxID=1978342 RepID=UPI000A196796|nr:low molecular weight phosphatase family protein [Leifsonia sp. NCR5]
MNTAPVVLFLCTHNAGRSQLGSHLFRHVAGDRARATSAGTSPADAPSEPVVLALAELGIDSSNAQPRAVTVDDLVTADVVVAMKPGLELPGPVAGRFVQWEFPDPVNWDLDGVRELRDSILLQVEELVEWVAPAQG